MVESKFAVISRVLTLVAPSTIIVYSHMQRGWIRVRRRGVGAIRCQVPMHLATCGTNPLIYANDRNKLLGYNLKLVKT